METDLQWWVWLVSGMALGFATGFGKGGVVGILLTIAVLASPAAIFMQAGAKPMPFVLFYGGLVVVSSILFRRKNVQRDAKRRNEIDAKRKQHFGG